MTTGVIENLRTIELKTIVDRTRNIEIMKSTWQFIKSKDKYWKRYTERADSRLTKYQAKQTQYTEIVAYDKTDRIHE